MIMFKEIQGLSILIEQQRIYMYALVLTHMEYIGCIGPLTYHEIDESRNDMHVKSGLFAVYLSSVSKLLMYISSWVEEILTYLVENLHQLLLPNIGMVYVTACDKLKSIVINRDISNRATQTQLPWSLGLQPR